MSEIQDLVFVGTALSNRIDALEFKLEAIEDKIAELESLYLMDGPVYENEREY